MNPNFLIKLLGSIKGLALGVVVPLITEIDPAVGAEIQIASDAFADGKVTLEEAENMAVGALNIGKEKVPAKARGFDLCIGIVKNDIPFITEHLIPDIEAVIAAFKE
jgi:hypothetical protein